MAIKTRTEHEEQTILVAWALVSEEMQTDPVKKLALHWLYATPNGFYRSPAARMKAKREGVKAGVLDLTVACPELGNGVRNSGVYHGLYVEMKRKGGTIRSGQTEFMDYLDLVHYNHALCYTWTAAAEVIKSHLALDKYFPIDEGRVDEILARASEIDLIRNPPRERAAPKRRARPRAKKKKASRK